MPQHNFSFLFLLFTYFFLYSFVRADVWHTGLLLVGVVVSLPSWFSAGFLRRVSQSWLVGFNSVFGLSK